MTSLFINIFALGTLISSVFSITSKNPVISVIFLISTFVQAALYLILIGINFVGVSYIVIYVGAIAVLFLFVIMLLNIRLTEITEVQRQYTKNLPLAFAVSSLFIYELFYLTPVKYNNVAILSYLSNLIGNFNDLLLNSNLSTNNIGYLAIKPISISPETILMSFSQIEVLGHSLYSNNAICLIIISIILLLAMFSIITITLTKNSKNNNTLTPFNIIKKLK